MTPNTFQALLEPERLASLRASELLDSPADEGFDRLTRLATVALNVPVALVSLVDVNRQFFKSQVGLSAPWSETRETPLSHSFCQYVAAKREPLIIEDAREHSLVRDNRAIEDLGVVAYAGMPLYSSDGQALGSFCAIDHVPRRWTSQQLDVLRDLSAVATTELELRQTARRLRDSLHQLETQQREGIEQSQLLVHDLRTPLASLLGGMQLMEMMGALNDQQRELLALSTKSGEKLLEMVNTLLDIAKMEGGALRVHPLPFRPQDLVEAAVRQVFSLAVLRDVQVSAQLEERYPFVRGDEDRLLRVLVNLLSNAIKFTPPGGRVRVSLQPSDDSMTFLVSDTGDGIPKDEIEHIFEKFAQLSTHSGHKMSTGIGLTFCKLAVEAHGGRIWVDSQPGRGSTFAFSIPLVPQL